MNDSADSMIMFWASACDGRQFLIQDKGDGALCTAEGRPVTRMSESILIITDRREVLTVGNS